MKLEVHSCFQAITLDNYAADEAVAAARLQDQDLRTTAICKVGNAHPTPTDSVRKVILRKS